MQTKMTQNQPYSESSSTNPIRPVPNLGPSPQYPEDPQQTLLSLFGEHALSSDASSDWRSFIVDTPPPDPAGDVLDFSDFGDFPLDCEDPRLGLNRQPQAGPAPAATPPETELIVPSPEDIAAGAELREYINNANALRRAREASPAGSRSIDTGNQTDTPGSKRRTTASSPEDANEPPTKKRRRPRRRKDEPEPDYSAIIREQVKCSTRTGQACDRCKVVHFHSQPLAQR